MTIMTAPSTDNALPIATLDEAQDVLDCFIAKRQELQACTNVASERYRDIVATERDERYAASRVSELEQRLASLGKRVVLGSVKPGEIPAVKTELETARQMLIQRQHTLGEQREALCTCESVRTDLLAELQGLRDQLAKSLPSLFQERFGKADPNLGQRGQVTWAVDDVNGVAGYKRTWKSRAFTQLFRSLLNLTDDFSDLHALKALITSSSFSVRIVIGFMITRSGGRAELFDQLGRIYDVPKDLTFEEGFEEIVRRRVTFVIE